MGFSQDHAHFYDFSALQTIIKLFLNENLTFVWYVASNVSFYGLCNAREPIYYSCCLYFLNFLLIESGWGNLMGEIQWNNSLCSLTYTDGVKIDIESDEQRHKKVARAIV